MMLMIATTMMVIIIIREATMITVIIEMKLSYFKMVLYIQNKYIDQLI